MHDVTTTPGGPHYNTYNADQKLAESLTRIFLEDYKETHKTTELPEKSWKNKYVEVYNNIINENEEEMIAALSQIIERCKQTKQHSLNGGTVSIQVVTNCKRLLEIRSENHDNIKIQDSNQKDLAAATSKIKLSEEEKQIFVDRLTIRNHSGSERAAINYEMYERAGSLKNLKADLERQTGLKLKMPEIQTLNYPSIYREQHVYCGTRIWFNIQILPIITVQIDTAKKSLTLSTTNHII